MRLPRFEYASPSTLADACALLAAHGTAAACLAGGTDLLVKMKHRRAMPKYVVNLKGIPGLDYIEEDDDGLRIGALTTIQSLKNSSGVRRHCDALAVAASSESSVQIRNLATLGGNIANASPAADAPLALIAAGASVKIRGANGERQVALEDFALAPGKTVLERGELLTEIHVPTAPPATGRAFFKHALRRTDIAIASVATSLTLDNGACSAVRIVLGSVAPTIMRARKAEAVLNGRVFSEKLVDEAVAIVARECSPIDDIRRSANYRRDIIVDLAKLALLKAAANARTGGA